MNIIYYLGAFPKLSESFILNEIYELEKKGHNVAVFAHNEPEADILHAEYDQIDIPVQYVPRPSPTAFPDLFSTKVLNRTVLKNIFYRAPPHHHAANLYWTKHCIDFVDSLEWEPDLIHSHFAPVTMFGGKYVADYYDVPFTLTVHAYGIYKEPVGTYTGPLLQSTDRIVTISEYNKTHIHENFAPETPIDIVRAGIRPEKFEPTEGTETTRVLTIGRLVEKKGIQYALEAVSIAAEQIPDIEYHIIGTGELKSDLIRKTEKLAITDNVTFLENVDDQRLIDEFDEARCFLLPCVIASSGDRDGIPVVLMEAMAMKTPSVSTTVSGIPELIDHKQNGLLTEPRNSEATADALVTLLQNSSEWSTYATKARRKVVEGFNSANEAKKLEVTFQSACSQNDD